MILMSGFVQVEHVRQKKSWSFTTRDEHFGVSLCELKETNTRSHFPREDELVTLEYNTNQEIEVIKTHLPLSYFIAYSIYCTVPRRLK